MLGPVLLLQAISSPAIVPVTKQGQEVVDLFASMCVETALKSTKAHLLDTQPAIARAMTLEELTKVMPGNAATEGWITKSPNDAWAALWFAPSKLSCGVTVREAEPTGMEAALNPKLKAFYGAMGIQVTRRPDEIATESGVIVHRANWIIDIGTPNCRNRIVWRQANRGAAAPNDGHNAALNYRFKPARQTLHFIRLLTGQSITLYRLFMGRPREFDRDLALLNAIQRFWAKGYAATSTEDLVQAMGIGRQSLYNAFGDKRQLYLEALASYLRTTCESHLKCLNTPASPLEGIGNMLAGLSSQEDPLHPSGCMAIGSVGEFGTTDAEIGEMMAKVASLITARVAHRIREGQAAGEIDRVIDADEAAGFVRVVVNGLQVAARGGATSADLAAMAGFAVNRLRATAG